MHEFTAIRDVVTLHKRRRMWLLSCILGGFSTKKTDENKFTYYQIKTSEIMLAAPVITIL